MQYLRLLLLPLSIVYGLIVWLRNKLYDVGVFKSQTFNLPIICIGNLAIGGAGKTPMAEYLIRLLKDTHKVAVLSRGYKRKTSGFKLVEKTDTLFEAGDEPLQYRNKFENITVAVSEKRAIGIEALKNNHEVIILDDAFQHRAVQAGLSILLFDYTRLNDHLVILPAGNLRESFSNRKRADIIVISKCPESLGDPEKRKLEKRIKPFKHQQLFFSFLEYESLIPVSRYPAKTLAEIKDSTVLLLTGIANPHPLLSKLRTVTASIIHHDYPDHHPFSQKNMIKLVEEFNECDAVNKLIITTEKDIQRLQEPALLELLKDLPVYYLPVRAKIHQPDEQRFNNLIENYASTYLHHNGIH
ncbi:MAG: tetraacyldisaccharide 4'-kinase [Pyrinomonadaceae bacterium]|nr:tetraacyldisaccharide 4'-kinase [Sphingobacteriaceae bacterium]